MIDGIRLKACIPDFQDWKSEVGLSFGSCLDPETGELLEGPKLPFGAKSAKLGCYQLTFYQKHNSKGGTLIVQGSLHKNHQAGSNHRHFSYQELQGEIISLCRDIRLSPEQVKIESLEVGLNLSVSFSPIAFLEYQLLIFKNVPFNRMEVPRSKAFIGFSARLSEYEFKIYDKGLQNGLNSNVLRMEVKIKKMRQCKGICTLEHILDPGKFFGLLATLLKAWDQVVLFEIPDLEAVEDQKTREFLKEARHRTFWERLVTKGQTFRDAKKKLRECQKKFGRESHRVLRDRIIQTWEAGPHFPDFTRR